MQMPTIHLNGTHPKDLYEANCEARDAIREAVRMLQRTAPNGRDYYPQGMEALDRATREHSARLERLYAVAREMDALCEYIVREGGERF